MNFRNLLFAVNICAAITAEAGVIDFRSASMEILDGAASLVVVEDGRRVLVATPNGVLNRSSSGFGVNSIGGGDDADGIDGRVTDEIIFISFDAPVSLSSITVSAFGRADSAWLIVDRFHQLIDRTGTWSLIGVDLMIGQLLSVSYHSGNGFSLDSLTFVPDDSPSHPAILASPSTLGTVTLAILWIVWMRRHTPHLARFVSSVITVKLAPSAKVDYIRGSSHPVSLKALIGTSSWIL
ncbi:MAG: hypothetical protein HOI95_03965 [Chromatiales bacterium]|jgi:hypothetical protein|nr:hypothetical protein [Chromatiales bacterium]